MAFSLDRFYRLNRKAIIWIILFGLIYVLREFFTLIFLSFILSFFAFQASKFISTRLRLSWSLSIILVYLTLAVGYVGGVIWISPSVVYQISSLQAKLPGYQTKLNEVRDEYAEQYPNLANLLGFNVESSLLNEYDIVDWPAFSSELAQANSPSATAHPGKRIMESLPDETKQEIEELSHRYEDELASNLDREGRINRILGGPADPAEQRGKPGADLTDDGQVETESDQTNTTQTQTLAPPSSIEPVTPESQAARAASEAKVISALNKSVIQRRKFYAPGYFHNMDADQQLLARSLDTLSNSEVEKFNRQLLENAYPDIIVKRRYVAEEKIQTLMDEYRGKIQRTIPTVIGNLFDFTVTSLLAILFSFLIVFDYARLSREVQSLASSKLSDFYEEAGQPVVRFALSVGRGFQAMVLIALITTGLLAPALMVLGIPSIALLAVIIFVTSLVPVIGVFFQFVPIVLVALNENGLNSALWAFGATLVVQAVTTYVIGPYIFGRQFKLNPVAVVFILFIANRFGGVWGMMLAVPVANYLLRDVFKVPFVEEKSEPLVLSPGDPVATADGFEVTSKGSSESGSVSSQPPLT